MPLFLYLRSSGMRSWFAVSWDFMKGINYSIMIFLLCSYVAIKNIVRVMVPYSSKYNPQSLNHLLKIFNNLVKSANLVGMLFHATGVILALIFPVIFSILRLLFTSQAMNWWVCNFMLCSLTFYGPLTISAY